MEIYEELRARGLIAQVTDEEEIRELVNRPRVEAEPLRNRVLATVGIDLVRMRDPAPSKVEPQVVQLFRDALG